MTALDPLAFTQPSTARMYNHYLGGRSAFEVDREAAEKIIRVAPDAPVIAKENFLFAGRAAAYAVATHRIGQVLDIGVGIVGDVPLTSVEDSVHTVDPDAVVVGCDNDDVVLAHARGMRPGYGGVLRGDVRDLDTIFGDPRLRKLLDLDAPLVVVLAAVLHFVPDHLIGPVMKGLRRRLAPGSVLVMSHATSSKAKTLQVDAVEEVYEDATSKIFFRTEGDIAAMVDGWDVVTPPGLCDVARWGIPRPHPGQTGQNVRVVGQVAVRPGGRRVRAARAPGGVS